MIGNVSKQVIALSLSVGLMIPMTACETKHVAGSRINVNQSGELKMIEDKYFIGIDVYSDDETSCA